MKPSPIVLLAAFVLASCAPPAMPAATATQAPRPPETETPSPAPTVAPSPTAVLPWVGQLYFDENHSGEQDPGERALGGFGVCVMKDCGTTDLEGRFNIPNKSGITQGTLTFTDPKQGTPDAMTLFVGSQQTRTVPAYEENGVSIPEQHLKLSSYLNQFPISSGRMQDIGLVKSIPLHTCPVDMSQSGTYVSLGFHQPMHNEQPHAGLDVTGPTGTHLLSPARCHVEYLYVGSNGGEGIQMTCIGIPGAYIWLEHVDFSLNNYDTLSWHGIPRDVFFDEGGTVRAGEILRITKNSLTYPGQDLHLYMDCTGTCTIPHVHIAFYKPDNSTFDPAEYLDCAKR